MNLKRKGMVIRMKLERNLELWNDRNHGFTYKELSEKYGINKERCRQIYLNIDRKMLTINLEAKKKMLNTLYGILYNEEKNVR